ncbi:MAG: hypothetical protein IKB77_00725 [Lentisphaeria bacterium]|nr:hypothetical protein [Lentisphaeria bacterium]
MGTTADKLQAVLNSKNAIKEKFNLGDIPFSQYAENINTAPGGIVIPENFNPASSADVWWNKQFFNCRGELQSGVFEDGTFKSVYMANINGKIPEKYYFLWGWYKSPYDDDHDYSPYIRVVSMPDGDRTFKAERKSDGNSFWWELYDADVGTVFFRSKARSASHEIWEITDDDDWEGIPDDLQGVTTYFETSLSLHYAPPSSYYLCSYVNRNYFSYNTIVVSGMPTAPFVGCTYVDENTWETKDTPADVAARDPNGTYTLQNPDEAVNSWYWQSENGCVIDHWNMGMGQPIIYPGKDYKNTNKYIYVESMMGEIPQYPVPDDYTSFEWKYSAGSGEDTVVSGGSVSAVKPAEVEKYWEGYKLEADESGKYNLSPDKTKLTYGDYMPVAGRIYDAAATLEITNADFTEDALWACPRNMTSAENDDWVVSSTSVYDNRAAWQAFDGNSGSSAWLNSGAWWIMWQNKKRKVLLRQIKIALDDNYILNKEAFLQGSNDGTEWVDIITPGNIITGSDSGSENGVNTVTIKIPDNGTPYSYYRLGSNYNTGSYSIIYTIEAYAQIPREVPK